MWPHDASIGILNLYETKLDDFIFLIIRLMFTCLFYSHDFCMQRTNRSFLPKKKIFHLPKAMNILLPKTRTNIQIFQVKIVNSINRFGSSLRVNNNSFLVVILSSALYALNKFILVDCSSPKEVKIVNAENASSCFQQIILTIRKKKLQLIQ